jgi:hypothetical protein
MREYWLQTKEQGRARFIRREVLGGLSFWSILVPAVQVFAHYGHPSMRSIIIGSLIMLPIFLLGGYLTGRWRWSDFEKKYPKDSLPPWE